MPDPLNVVGPVIRRLREERGLTQEQVAARCQVKGFDLTRGTLAKIESQVRAVSDHELPFIAEAVGVGIADLFPEKPQIIIRKPRNPSGTSKRAARSREHRQI